MFDDDSPESLTGSRVITWFFAVALVAVVLAVGTVAWNCIDSLQKHSAKVERYNEVHEEAPSKDPHLQEEIDKRVNDGKMDLVAAIQTPTPQGSEVLVAKGMELQSKKEYAQAATSFARALVAIPVEGADKHLWHVNGMSLDRRTYMATVYEQRGLCYGELKYFKLSAADFSAAIKLRPDYIANYTYRARVYSLLGLPALANADIKTAQDLSKKQTR